jgi:cytochrome b involved in lipid metabolism
MMRFMYTCFVAFWASVISIWAFAVLAAGAARAAAPQVEAAITVEELAEHAAADDCWMAIDGSVYDLSDYLPRHPTPPTVLTPWCGKEASEPYRTKGYGRPHSAAADALLPNYRVGTLTGEDPAPAP